MVFSFLLKLSSQLIQWCAWCCKFFISIVVSLLSGFLWIDNDSFLLLEEIFSIFQEAVNSFLDKLLVSFGLIVFLGEGSVVIDKLLELLDLVIIFACSLIMEWRFLCGRLRLFYADLDENYFKVA